MYQAVRDVLEGAVDAGMGEGSQGRLPLDTGLSASLAHSAEVFSAFKVHRMQQDMARLLYDDQGNLRSFREWRELAAPIASHQVGPWLETEYNTAVLRAQQAAEWQQFEAEADVLPNLRWVPSTSVHPGADHQVFWNVIRPIHDPFWDLHRPGDRWNCKCSLEPTDEKPTAIPKGYELRGNGPQAGLNENPGKTGELFAQSHPYFPQTCAQCAFYQGGIVNGFKNQEKDCLRCQWVNRVMPMDSSLEELTRRIKEIRTHSEEICKASLRNDAVPFSPGLTKSRIKEWLNQPHKHYAEKNELILDIETVFKDAVYKGYGPDKHDPDAKMHLFEIEILGDKSWIVVREYFDGKTVLHSISDSPSILGYITNAK